MKADPKAINRLLKTARGQMDGILKMVEDDQYCLDISHQISACVAILQKANREIIRRHMESCVKHALDAGNPEEAQRKLEEIVTLIRKMSL